MSTSGFWGAPVLGGCFHDRPGLVIATGPSMWKEKRGPKLSVSLRFPVTCKLTRELGAGPGRARRQTGPQRVRVDPWVYDYLKNSAEVRGSAATKT